jgi:hypothetical protein
MKIKLSKYFNNCMDYIKEWRGSNLRNIFYAFLCTFFSIEYGVYALLFSGGSDHLCDGTIYDIIILDNLEIYYNIMFLIFLILTVCFWYKVIKFKDK